jgi:hypothetical protein
VFLALSRHLCGNITENHGETKFGIVGHPIEIRRGDSKNNVAEHHSGLSDHGMRFNFTIRGDLDWIWKRSYFTIKYEHCMELIRQNLVGIARYQVNIPNLGLKLFYTCGNSCEDKPGIPA